MNKCKLILPIFSFLLLFLFVQCSNNEDKNEYNAKNSVIDKGDFVIEKEINEIEFKFCLLNQDSVPAISFKEGEKFYCYFSIRNLSKDIITVDEGNLFCDDFFMVYQGKTQIGKPWYAKFCQFRVILPNLEIPENQPYKVILPWPYKHPDEIGRVVQGFFCVEDTYNEENINDFLSKGAYSCRFKMDFLYKRNDKEQKNKDMFFEINFKIE